MRNRSVSVAALGIAAAFALAACSSSGGGNSGTSSQPAGGSSSSSSSSVAPPPSTGASSSGGGGTVDGKGAKVGIVLPDTTSSPRWVSADPDALKAACKKYNVQCQIQNGQGSAQKQKTIAEQMEASGIKVLMLVDLDPASGAAIEQEAEKNGVTVIDYDRLTPNGGAALYVSFDNVKVGEVQGKTLTQCSQVKNLKSVNYVEIDGAASDNNATLFNQGYESVLSKQPGWKLVDEQDGNWDATTAQREFTQMLQKTPNIKAVMVANDTMAGGVITVLQRQNLNGKVAVSGQDATAGGLQQIMLGNQCLTIYKPSAGEAYPAVQAAAMLANGQVPDTHGVTVTDPATKKKVPAILATPIAITQKNVAQPINDGYTPKSTVCTGQFVSLCKKFGVK